MKRDVLEILNRLFQNLLIVYLVMLLANEFELIFYPSVTTPLLVIVLVLGVVSALFYTPKEEKKERTLFDTLFIFALGIVGTALVFFKTRDLGMLSYLISLISGVLIVLLGFLVYEEDEEEMSFEIDKKHIIMGSGILFGLTVALSFFYGLQVFRIVFGSIYVLFLPGFSLSYAFFGRGQVDMLERVALSFALSIAVVPLVVFYLNLVGMPINEISVAAVVLFIIIIGLFLYKKQPFKNVKIPGFKGHSTK